MPFCEANIGFYVWVGFLHTPHLPDQQPFLTSFVLPVTLVMALFHYSQEEIANFIPVMDRGRWWHLRSLSNRGFPGRLPCSFHPELVIISQEHVKCDFVECFLFPFSTNAQLLKGEGLECGRWRRKREEGLPTELLAYFLQSNHKLFGKKK